MVCALFLHGVGQVAFHSEHLGLRRPVYVGVEDAYAESHVSQGDREVGRDGRFAYPALSRCDGNDLGDAARGRLQLGFGARGGAALLDDYQYRLTGEFAFEQFLGLVFDFHCERVARLGEAEYDGDFSGRRGDLLDKTAADDVLPRFGMDERREQMSDFFFHICVVTFPAKITYILQNKYRLTFFFIVFR